MLETCDERCGWIAVAIACLSFGSFGVPIKCQASEKVDVDPLVFQSYKSFMCFATSWFVLFLGEELTFTPWGIVSGFFWVPGGAAAIYGIRKSGLAVSQGVWSSVIVMVSFSWGIFVFHEQVRSIFGACLGAFLLICGLVGMSVYASQDSLGKDECLGEDFSFSENSTLSSSIESGNARDNLEEPSVTKESSTKCSTHRNKNGFDSLRRNLPFLQNPVDPRRYNSIPCSETDIVLNNTISVFSIQLTEFQLGILCAAFDGIWAGTMMVPLKFSGPETKGLQYVISFGIGAMIITIFLWFLRFVYYLVTFKSVHVAYAALPSFHINVMWRPGALAGLLWSIGNICSIMSVTALGQGIGYSVVQSALLVSGLWGIYWYREIKDPVAVRKWFISAFITLCGMLWLSYEHKA